MFNLSDTVKLICVFFFFFYILSQVLRTQVGIFSDQVGVESWINLQLTDKISFKLDFNSSLLLIYGYKSFYC